MNDFIEGRIMHQRAIIKLWCVLFTVFFTGCCCEDGDNGQDGKDGATAVLIVPDEISDIQAAIDTLSIIGGGTVYIKSGVYDLSKGIHINSSNITLTGEQGTLLKLNNNVNQPVLLIGDDAEVPDVSIENIKIEKIEIDGNKDFQNSETDSNRSWIRNNCIDIRKANDVRISEVDLHDARSGGIVVSWDSRYIFIDNSFFHHNFFDGIALYDSEDIFVTNFFCHYNQAAGLSLDNDLKGTIISTGSIKNNGDVGIFARHSMEVEFSNLVIAQNLSHGCFLSHESINTETGVNQLLFTDCSFYNNEGYGFWLASPASESSKITIQASIFSDNIRGAINMDPNGELYQTGNVFL